MPGRRSSSRGRCLPSREELLERARSLGLPYAEEVADFCSAIIEAFEPWCIIIHGSVARSDYVLGRSDVDVLVISDRFEGMDVRDRIGELLSYGAGRAILFEALGFTREEALHMLEDLNLLMLDALHHGKVIYDRGFYKQLKARFEELVAERGLVKIRKGWMATR